GQGVERAPQAAVQADDEDGHDRDPGDHPRRVALGGGVGDERAEALGLYGGLTPAGDLGHDRGVPRAARGGEGAGDVEGEDAGQGETSPPGPGGEAVDGGGLAQVAGQGAGPGDDVEQDVPLGAEHHQRRQPDVRVELEGDDGDHGEGEQDVGREGGQDLGQGLDPLGPGGAQADPDADRDPDQAGQGDQHQHADQGQDA